MREWRGADGAITDRVLTDGALADAALKHSIQEPEADAVRFSNIPELQKHPKLKHSEMRDERWERREG